MRTQNLKPSLSAAAIASIVLFTLSSCGTLTQKECEQSHWAKRGYTTARLDETPLVAYRNYHQECKEKFGIEPDKEIFLKGYNQGLMVSEH